MNFSKTTSYALNILSFMATDKNTNMLAAYLHKKLNIPYSYLRQVLRSLSKTVLSGALKEEVASILSTKKRRIYISLT